MSTLKVAAINNPSASSGGLAISASGNVTGAGLDLITTQSFSAVSSVSVNNCFSATYDNYRLLVNFTRSASGAMNFRLRASGSDASTSIYSWAARYWYPSLSQAGDTYGNAQSAWNMAVMNTTRNAVGIDLWGPFTATNTNGVYGVSGQDNSALNQLVSGVVLFTDANAYDGITLYPASGTMTGSLSVFGYRK